MRKIKKNGNVQQKHLYNIFSITNSEKIYTIKEKVWISWVLYVYLCTTKYYRYLSYTI